MLTIFAIPKPFEGIYEHIQRNAIRSWTLLEPRCEIFLCGNDNGTAEIASEFGVKHLPDVVCNEYGTPLLDSAFTKVAAAANYPRLVYINADIILLDDFLGAVQRIPFRRFLMAGQRWNVDLKESWDFEQPDWEKKLRAYVLANGKRAKGGGSDYFVFSPDGEIEQLPHFAVGRPYWDNWFFFHARKLGLPVIDATQAVLAIHQNHDYSHVAAARGKDWHGPEGDRNLEMIKTNNAYPFNLLDATHQLTPTTFKTARDWKYIRRRVFTLQYFYPVTRKPVRLVHNLWRGVRVRT